MADDDGDEGSSGRIKPNGAFLARVLRGVGKTNQRVIDTGASKAARKVCGHRAGRSTDFCSREQASRAAQLVSRVPLCRSCRSCQALGASGAASLRPLLARALKQGPAAVRRATLTAAQQQKLTLCTSLLTEVRWAAGAAACRVRAACTLVRPALHPHLCVQVALSFGFRLHVHGPDGALASPGSIPPGPGTGYTSPQPRPAGAAKQEGGAVPDEDEQPQGEQQQGAGPAGAAAQAAAQVRATRAGTVLVPHASSVAPASAPSSCALPPAAAQDAGLQPLPLEDLDVSLGLEGDELDEPMGAQPGVLLAPAPKGAKGAAASRAAAAGKGAGAAGASGSKAAAGGAKLGQSGGASGSAAVPISRGSALVQVCGGGLAPCGRWLALRVCWEALKY